MNFFTYHLVETNLVNHLRFLLSAPNAKNIEGLVHIENTTCMELGAPIVSTSRFQIGKIAAFAQWKDEESFEKFLNTTFYGKLFSTGWYTKLLFVRQWGDFHGFKIPSSNITIEPQCPVVAVTIARMKFLQIPRFLHWGRPVEKLVRDHHGTTLSLGTIRFPNTVSTFSIWETQKQMSEMVHGKSKVEKPKRHSVAMEERERKNFHHEFTTLRFKPISEHGQWKGKSNFISFGNNK